MGQQAETLCYKSVYEALCVKKLYWTTNIASRGVGHGSQKLALFLCHQQKRCITIAAQECKIASPSPYGCAMSECHGIEK